MKITIICLLFLIATACMQTEKTVRSEGVDIHYHVYNPKGSPTLLFIHGWSCDQSYWRNQLPFFAKNYRVVTLDLAGHGQSGSERTEWSIQNFARDVQAVIRFLQPDDVILIGHSMGGSVMLETYLLEPQKIRALIGVDTFKDIEQKPRDDESIASILQPYRKNFQPRVYELAWNMTADSSDSSLRTQIAADMSAAPPEIALQIQEHLMRYDYKTAFQKVQIPIRCINSDQYENNIAAAKRNTRSYEITFMPNVRHFGMLENPATFNTLLSEILQRL